MSDELDVSEIAALRAELAEKTQRITVLEEELREARRESAERWQAIERLAPAAKRLRIERDKLLEQLEGDGS